MCWHCWKNDYDFADVDNDKVRKAVKLIRVVENGFDRGLHAIIDDWNLEDEHLNGYGELSPAEIVCSDHLKTMTVAERASALAKSEGFTKEVA